MQQLTYVTMAFLPATFVAVRSFRSIEISLDGISQTVFGMNLKEVSQLPQIMRDCSHQMTHYRVAQFGQESNLNWVGDKRNPGILY